MSKPERSRRSSSAAARPASVGYHLAKQGRPFVILDANERIGDAWRKRWDSLRLFTPAKFDGAAGMPFPGAAASFPTKDEMADYLEAYAARFELPVRTGVAGRRLRATAAASSSRPATALRGGATWSSRSAQHRMPQGSRLRVRARSARSCSSTRRVPQSGAAREATCSSSAPATRAPRSPIELPTHRVLARAGRVGEIPSHTAPCRCVSASASSGSWATVLEDRHADRPKGRAEGCSNGRPLIRIKAEGPRGCRRRARPAGGGRPRGLPVLEDDRCSTRRTSSGARIPSGLRWIDLPVFDERRPAAP